MNAVSAYVDEDVDGYTVGEAVDVCLECSDVASSDQYSTGAVSGTDSDNHSVTILSSDLPLDANGAAPSTVVISAAYDSYSGPWSWSYPSSYDGSYWDISLTADSGVAVSSGDTITGFTSLTISASDADDWSDDMYLELILDLVYPATEVCELPAGYSATSLGEDCNDTLSTATQDLGCGCGEAAAATGFDCDGNFIVPTCSGFSKSVEALPLLSVNVIKYTAPESTPP